MKVPNRSEVLANDTWDLGPLYQTPDAWESDYTQLQDALGQAAAFQGTLGSSPARVLEAVQLQLAQHRVLEKIYVFAHLRNDQDTTDATQLGLYERASSLASRLGEAWSFFTPELLSFSEEQIAALLSNKELAPYYRMLREITRYKPHTLSPAEEQLLAGASEVFSAAERVFSQLNNADLRFGTIEIDGQELPLTHGSYVVFLKKTDRAIREFAFNQYYGVFDAHRHTIASTLSSSIKRDAFVARTRKYPSALERSLFSDDVPVSVYDNLIGAVHSALPHLHRYYEIRKSHLKLDELKIFDTYIPLVPEVETEIPYDEAAELVVESVAPLGKEYQDALRKGMMTDRWVDRYENIGKRSGAYSSGCYDSPPYMLMNYKKDSLNDVFTLAHEAGHSMHTLLSSKNQPYQDANYTIFVAEVASTFNEQLLLRLLRQKYAGDVRMQAFLINHQIDEIKSTLYRQTMFAEFEKLTHAIAEKHQPLTGDAFREVYAGLLKTYFGPTVTLGTLEDLECFRIPHFYHAFYVYKYATGISAAIALSRMVLEGGDAERNRYLGFLKSGGSKFPLELLQSAGVDLTTPAPISKALELFGERVDELQAAIKSL